MTVLNLGFIGIRTDRLDETVALFRDVLGVSINKQTDDLVAFKLADGTVLEQYSPANEFHSFSSRQARWSHSESTILMSLAGQCLRLASHS
ncbi:MAG TPA: hypothetical protein VNY08_00175 [Bradyrhizobium sp.]|nr:hypothetical protein [Bradyrhizobium sp.]